MLEGRQAIYERILNVAIRGEVTNYSDIAPLAGLNMDWPPDRVAMGNILDHISEAEHREGRPLLSAVVVRRDTDMPGDGFFDLAQHLRLHEGGVDR